MDQATEGFCGSTGLALRAYFARQNGELNGFSDNRRFEAAGGAALMKQVAKLML